MIIYVRLLNEGTDVWRPVEATVRGENLFQIKSDQPDDEEWEFQPGEIVKAQPKLLEGKSELVASRY